MPASLLAASGKFESERFCADKRVTTSCDRGLSYFCSILLLETLRVALHLTVVQLTCNENGDPDILLLARFHAQPGGVDHGSHDGILPQSALPCQRPNRPGQYRYPFAEGTAVHLPRVPEDVQRHHRHRVVPPAHRGRDGEPRGDVACPWVPRASDCGGLWVRRTHHRGVVGPLGPAGPSRARVSRRTTTR